jgi:hypothetical protein
MPRVSSSFFLLACICLLAGMLWGMHMAQSQDHTMTPAHAHLNLFAVLAAIFGTFHALARETYSPRLAWATLVLILAGTAITIPALALLLSTNDEAKYGPITGAGSGLVALSLIVFTVSVVRELVRKRI